MNKRFLTLATSLMMVASMMAIPARPSKRQVKQPDGTVLTIMTRGDENFHFTCTEDGMPLVKGADGAFYYAKLDAAKLIVSTGQMAHDAAQRSATELSFLKSYEKEASSVCSLGQEVREKRNAARVARLAKSSSSKAKAPKKAMAGAWGGEGIGITGKRKGLVILVNFKDKAMLASHTQEEWNNFFNEEGYSKLGNSGSVHDYFKAQSYGQFDLTFDVVGPVTVSKNMADYGGNDSYGNDKDPAGMVYEACKLVDSQVDFSQYDWDGDGEVDQVFLIYAGYGESANTDLLPETIWPHEWDLTSNGYSLNLDGVDINTYGCSAELYGYTGTFMDGIGTPCHEFSHCLGLPDMYDTNYKGGFGLDSWGIMDVGSYGGDGFKPVGYNSYEKWVSGWLQPTELKSPCYVKDLKPLSDSPEAYIVYNEKTPTEYYLFENRQLKGTDSELPASGMLVLHIDYDKNAWERNEVNNTINHQRITIVPADNKLTSKTVSGDTYPGTSNNTSLTDTSSPAATLFNANADGRKYLGKPITDIAETDGNISFTFDGGVKIDTPDGTTATDITPTSFKATWNVVEGAESYSVQLREKSNQSSPEESLIYGEDMTKWGADLTQDDNTDISELLDEYMSNPGWTGEKIYESPSQAKIGSSKKTGKLVSPLVNNHNSSSVTVRLLSSAYGNDAAQMTVSLLDSNDTEISSETITPDGTMATIVLANASEKDYKVKICPKKRGYVKSVAIYDGEFSADAFESVSSAPASTVTLGEAKASLGVAKASSVQYNDITATSYSFTNLTENGTYQWRVKAIAGNAESAWTDWQTVVLTSETGINTINGTSSLSASDVVEVYNMSGTSLGKMPFSEFSANASIHGAYILKSNGKTMKAIK